MSYRSKLFIKNILPKRLRFFLYKVGFFFAKDLDEIGLYQPSMEWSLKNLKKLGFNPRSTIDVGAYQGSWTLMLKTIFPRAKVLMIEAQEDKEIYLKRIHDRFGPMVDYSINVLGSTDNDEVVFTEMETGSSVFEQQCSLPRKKSYRKTETLDSVALKYGYHDANLLKLDVQGYELEILKGARSTLESVDVIVMEVALIGVNKGAPLFNEVLDFMKQIGFVPYDICSLIRRPLDGALWQVDMIFVRIGSSFLSEQSYS